MELSALWRQLCLVFGILICWSEALPMDMDEMIDKAANAGGMAAVAAGGLMGAASDAIQNAQPKGSINFASSFGSAGGSSDSDEDRKRRRRSTNGEELVLPPSSPEERRKRSPCGGRRMQATTVAPANGAGGAAGAAGAGGAPAAGGAPGAGGAAGAGGGNADVIPRRKRSSDPNDIDENADIIPVQRTFGEKAQEIGEKLHQKAKEVVEKAQQLMSTVAEAMTGLFKSPSDSELRQSEGL